MKVLCLCQGGNSRSAGLAYVLKYGFGHDAIACGWQKNSPETRRMLYEWADRILIAQEIYASHVPDEFKHKMTVYELGPDVWRNSMHPDLVDKCDALIRADARWFTAEVPA